MVQFEVDVEGMVAALRVAGENLGQHLPMALQLGGDLVAAEAKRNHSYKDRTGALTNSIMRDHVQGSFDKKNLECTVAAGVPYGGFVEFGTKPHTIRPKYRRALRWPVEGGFVFRSEVHHPGTQPTFFLRRAVESQFLQVQELLQDATMLSFAQAGFEIA